MTGTHPATIRSSTAPARSSACISRPPPWRPTAPSCWSASASRAGWNCLDLGCGPGGITALLSERVGPTGRVVGLDADAVFLEHARRSAAPNVEFVAGDAYRTGLPAALLRSRPHALRRQHRGRPEALLAEAMRLARPGGVVAMQEPDMATLICYPPHPAWDRLRAALVGAFASVGADINLARRLYPLARHAGLCGRAVPAVPDRRALGRSDGRLSAVDGASRSRGTIVGAGTDVETRTHGGARGLPRASAQSRCGRSPVYGGAGVGPGGVSYASAPFGFVLPKCALVSFCQNS